MGARSQLADLFTAGLHKQRYTVIDVPRDIDELSPKRRIVQIICDTIKPAPASLGSYEEKYAIWLLSPKKNQPEAENDLESALYDVLGILGPPKWVRWDLATRAVHVSGAQAYRIDITIYATRDQGTPTLPFGSGGFGDGTFN